MSANEMNVVSAPFAGLMFSYIRLNSFFIIRSTQAFGFEVMILVAFFRSLPLIVVSSTTFVD